MSLWEFADKHPGWMLGYLIIAGIALIGFAAELPRITIKRHTEERLVTPKKKEADGSCPPKN